MKTKNLLLSFILFLTVLPATAQDIMIGWQKSLGGWDNDYAHSIQQTSDGGYIVVGQTYSKSGEVTDNHGGSDYWIVKLTSAGIIDWQQSLGGKFNDVVYSIQQTSDSGYILAGKSYSNDGDVTGNHGFDDYWIVKLTNSGAVDWQKSLGGTENDWASSIQQTSDNGYIIAGYSTSNDGEISGNHGGADYWIVKLTNSGVIDWQQSLGGTSLDWGRSIQQTSDGGYIVAGNSASNDGDVANNHGGFDYWIVKLTSSGAIDWRQSYGGSSDDIAYSIQETKDGGYIVAGSTGSTDGEVSDNHGGLDYWVVKLRSTGDMDWQKTFGGTANDEAKSIQQTTDGGYIVTGNAHFAPGDTTGNNGLMDYLVIKLTNTGEVEWQKSLGGTGYDLANSIRQTSDGGYIVAGTSGSNDGEVSGNHGASDSWVVKLCYTQYSELTLYACNGQSVGYNGTTLYPNEEMDFTLNSFYGCDSIVSVFVEEAFSTSETITVEACAGTFYEYAGEQIPAGTSRNFQYVNNSGCDSIIKVIVEEWSTSFENIEFQACEGEYYEYNGEPILAGESRTYVMATVNGCDSIEVVTVNSLQSNFTDLELEICQGETYHYNGQEYGIGTSEIFVFQNADGCDSILQLKILESPDFTFDYQTEIFCFEDPGYLTVTNALGATSPFVYSLDGINFKPQNIFSDLEPGDYLIYVQDKNGCIQTTEAKVLVYDRLNFRVHDVVWTCDSDSAQLIPELLSEPGEGLKYKWPDGSVDESFFAKMPGNYFFEVSNICEEKFYSIVVQPAINQIENYLYIPNVFSPNGDGVNDYFQVLPSENATIHSYEMHVFSRWGEELYFSKDVNKAWDGKLIDGRYNPGVYVWYLKMDATYCGTRKEIFEEGNVTIIR